MISTKEMMIIRKTCKKPVTCKSIIGKVEVCTKTEIVIEAILVVVNRSITLVEIARTTNTKI